MVHAMCGAVPSAAVSRRVPDSAGITKDRSDSKRSANNEAFFVQQDAVPGSELDPPLTRSLIANGVATIRAVAACGIGANGKLDHLAQAVAAIPSMLHGCNRRRLYPRVEEERARTDWKAWGNALPIASAG